MLGHKDLKYLGLIVYKNLLISQTAIGHILQDVKLKKSCKLYKNSHLIFRLSQFMVLTGLLLLVVLVLHCYHTTIIFVKKKLAQLEKKETLYYDQQVSLKFKKLFDPILNVKSFRLCNHLGGNFSRHLT